MITQWVLVIVFNFSPAGVPWVKEIPVPNERACQAAIAGRGRSTMTPTAVGTAFDDARVSLICVETGIVGAD